MKILLIYTGVNNIDIHHYSKGIEKNRGIYPAVGTLYVARAAMDAGYKVKYIDLEAESVDINTLIQKIINYVPDVIGFYSFTWTFGLVRKIASIIKHRYKSVLTVIGGPQVTSFPKESLENEPFDFGIQGESERSFVELMKKIVSETEDFKDIDNLIHKKNGFVVVNSPGPYIQNLDEYSPPAWNLIDFNNYFDILTREKLFAPLIASRGCPFDCTYCDRCNRMGKKWRVRSASNVVNEIRFLNDQRGIKEFMFYDDNFVIDKVWVKEFCKLLKNLNRDIIWEIRTRVDLVDKDLLNIMKESGLYRIRYGFESGSNNILKRLKKNITVEQCIKTAHITHNCGIEILGYFMLGLPGDNEDTMNQTIKLALEINPTLAFFSKLILIPGSEVFEWAFQNGYIDKNYWIDFCKGVRNNPAPALDTPELPEFIVNRFIKKAYLKFYVRPNFIINYIKMLKNFYQLKKHLRFAVINLFSF